MKNVDEKIDIEISQRVGNIIKELRLMKGLKQNEVAKLLNLPLTTYNAYELGYNRQHAELIIELASLYNVTTDRILGIEDKQYVPLSIITINDEGMRQVHSLNNEQFKIIQAILNVFEPIDK